eukprot:4012951-Pleurochrysis_carterae.AAC.2
MKTVHVVAQNETVVCWPALRLCCRWHRYCRCQLGGGSFMATAALIAVACWLLRFVGTVGDPVGCGDAVGDGCGAISFGRG